MAGRWNWAAAAALAVGALGALPAQGADMALRGSMPAYEPTGPNWGGVYVGAFGGVGAMNLGTNGAAQNFVNQQLSGWAFADGTSQATAISNIMLLNPVNASPRVFGGFIGYQAQFEDAVIGIEADYTNLSGPRGGATVYTPPASLLISGDAYQDRITPTVGVSAYMHDYWTVRGRAGWAVGRFMPYMTAGLAIARGSSAMSYQASCTRIGADTVSGSTTCSGGRAAVVAESTNRIGFGLVGGAGMEALITDNLFARVEYQYLRVPAMAGVPVTLHSVRAGIAVKY